MDKVKRGLPEKLDRNKEIAEKKLAGETYRSLSREYNLSITRLQNLVNRYRESNNLEKGE